MKRSFLLKGFLRSGRAQFIKMWKINQGNSHYETTYIFKFIINNISFEIYCVHTCLDNLPNFHEVLLYLNIKERFIAHFCLKALWGFFPPSSIMFCLLMCVLVMRVSREFMNGWGIQVVASWSGQYQIQSRNKVQKVEWYWLTTGIMHRAYDGYSIIITFKLSLGSFLKHMLRC